MLAIWGRNQHASFRAILFADSLLPRRNARRHSERWKDPNSRHFYDHGHVPHLVNEGGSYPLGIPFQGVRSSSRGPQTVPACCEYAPPCSPRGLRLACGPPPRERRGAREAPGVVGRASSFANEAHRNPDGDQAGKEFGHGRWVVAGGARPLGPQ